MTTVIPGVEDGIINGTGGGQPLGLLNSGAVISIVKVGSEDDPGLRRERAVLGTLAGRATSRLVVPDLLSAVEIDGRLALRTGVVCGAAMAPPYEWSSATLELVASVLSELHAVLADSIDAALPILMQHCLCDPNLAIRAAVEEIIATRLGRPPPEDDDDRDD